MAPCLTPFLIVNIELTWLLGVDEDKKAEEGDGEAPARVVAGHHLQEHLGVHCDIKGAAHVHGTGKDLAAVPEEVVNGLENGPSTHVPRDAGLVGELEIIEAEGVPEQDDDDPVDKLEDEATNGNTAVVLAGVETAKFILDNGH